MTFSDFISLHRHSKRMMLLSRKGRKDTITKNKRFMIQYIVTKNINENIPTQYSFGTIAYCSFQSASFKEEGISDSEPIQNLRNLLFLILHPPKEMPCSEDWLT